MAVTQTRTLQVITKKTLLAHTNTNCTLVTRSIDKELHKKTLSKRMLCSVILDSNDNFWLHSVKNYNGVPSFKTQLTNEYTKDDENINMYDREIVFPDSDGSMEVPIDEVNVEAVKKIMSNMDSNIYSLQHYTKKLNATITGMIIGNVAAIALLVIGTIIYYFYN